MSIGDSEGVSTETLEFYSIKKNGGSICHKFKKWSWLKLTVILNLPKWVLPNGEVYN